MTITFIGHLCTDVDVLDGAPRRMPGGGVLHNGMTAQALGARVEVVTRCAAADTPALARDLTEAGVEVRVRTSGETTSIENVYPDDRADHRLSRLLAQADPFEADDVQGIEADVVHVNPLWYGEFPPELLPSLRARARLLGADAQGFLRKVGAKGRLFLRDWADKDRWMPLFDVFKADISEAAILTGTWEVHPAAEALHGMGAREVVVTSSDGVCVYDGTTFHDAPFGPYALSGRTGRGDTCSAAYLVARSRMDVAEATQYAARITATKLQYPGPFRGPAGA